MVAHLAAYGAGRRGRRMTPKQAQALVGRTIVAIDPGGSWEADEHGRNRQYMHYPSITLDNGVVLRFHAEEHPSGDGQAYGVDIVVARPRKSRG